MEKNNSLHRHREAHININPVIWTNYYYWSHYARGPKSLKLLS